MDIDFSNQQTITFLLLKLALIVCCFVICLRNSAFDSVSRNKVREMREEDPVNKKAERLAVLLEDPTGYRYTNRLTMLILFSVGLMLAVSLSYNNWISAIAYIAVYFIFAEVMPRKIARQNDLAIALSLAGYQSAVDTIISPVVKVLIFIADIFLKIFRQKTDVGETSFDEDRIMSMLEEGQASGELKEEGKKMIGKLFQFDDELAYEIMTPRTDVFMIDITDPPEEYLDQLMELRYTRMPVCNGGSDDIIGILHLKDYLIKARETGFDKVDIKEILRKPYFVPDTKKIDTLFFELQKEKQHIAILIDEYGGFSGIVTLEDIIEEIVGEIDDEYDEENESITKTSDDTYLIDGNVDLDDLNEAVGIHLTSDTSETIGGYLIDMIGEIPKDGYINQSIVHENLEFTILSVKERRVEKIRLTIMDPEEFSDREEDREESREQ